MPPSPAKLMRKFRQYRGVLVTISAAYATAWKTEVEEPYSLALVLFASACHRWRKDSHPPFRKYLAVFVRRGLNDEQKTRITRARLLPRVPLDDAPARSEGFDLTLFVESLSPDAREAVRAALTEVAARTRGDTGGTGGRTRGAQGGRVRADVRHAPSRTAVEDHIMRTRRWTRDRTRRAFQEIQEALTTNG